MKAPARSAAIEYLNLKHMRGDVLSVTGDALAEAAGVSRRSVYRDAEVMSVWARLKADAQAGALGASTLEQRVAKLKQRVSVVERDNERLLTNFIVAARRLTERGIDPCDIFGDAAPHPKETAWESRVIPWDEP